MQVRSFSQMRFAHWKHVLLACWALLTFAVTANADTWWNKEWPLRKKITIDTTGTGAAISDPIGKTAVLIRLHDGNFQFAAASEDGKDIRFVAEDDKTLLPFHIERYDGLLNEGFAWVQIPDVKPSAKTNFWLYYGNPAAPRADDAKGTYDATTTLVYHLAESNGTPADSSSGGNKADAAGVPVAGSLIGGGLRFAGQTGVSTPNSASLAWTEGGALTWSAWIKPTALRDKGVIFSRRDAGKSLVIGENSGVPFVEIDGQTSSTGAPIAVNTWHHLAMVAESGKATLFLDGQSYGTLSAPLPASTGALVLGKDSEGDGAFTGEVDELQISKIARPVGALKLAAITESGSAQAGKALIVGPDEGSAGGGHSKVLEHVMLFGDIAKNMMFDGWMAIGVCVLMIGTGWTVAVRKFHYLNSIQQGSEAFLKQWAHVSSDLTVLDHADEESIRNMGGNIDKKTLRNLHRAPLYHLYHIGSEEIRMRIGQAGDRAKGLSARSMQAIRASLDSGLVRENHRMNKGLIFLTISIAGGPYVGLLGTVVGVMITFAIIAKSGEVDVNSIAPGIASALLATVAGLIVAIPALFMYSYLSSRIKDLLGSMQVFIDEFIAKMAEFYPTPADLAAAGHAPREAQGSPRQSNVETVTSNSNNAHAS